MFALPRKSLRAEIVLLVRSGSHAVSSSDKPVAARIDGLGLGQATLAGLYPSGATGDALFFMTPLGGLGLVSPTVDADAVNHRVY